MLRAIKYELNPTNAQKDVIKQTCGCCRLVYNTMLDRKISAYNESGTTISDCGWSMFLHMLEYKCDNLVRIDQWYASSQTCFVCGYKEKQLKDLSIREWTCPQCGSQHNRDLNAAKNIEREGLSLCGHKVSH